MALSVRSEASLLPWRRGALNEWENRHRVQWELAMGLMTVVYVVLGVVSDDMSSGWAAPARLIELGLSGIFLSEFTVRIIDAKDRSRYFARHWLDLLTAVPSVGFVHLSFLRLLRLLRLASAIRHAVLRHVNDEDARQTWMLVPTLILLWVISAYALWLSEHGVNDSVKTFFDALRMSALTTMTLGYGSFKAVTVAGQLTFAFDVFAAIGIVGVASSRLTAVWFGADDQKRLETLLETQMHEVNAQIGRLDVELSRLADMTAAVRAAVCEPPR